MSSVAEAPAVAPGLLRRVIAAFRNWSTSRAAYPLGYSPGLDGVRGLMTLGVLMGHTRIALMPGVIVFMDSFFTMSGYLITSLLINDLSKRGRIDFKKFYLRRIMRLYPALIAMCLTLLIVAFFFSSEFKERVIDATVSLLYISNYWRIFGTGGLWYTVHTWSLAIEEQFYLLWPVTFLLLVRRFGLSWSNVSVVLLLAVGFALWRAWLAWQGAPYYRLYNGFDTRADALLVGCALAIALKIVDLSKYPRLSKALAWSLLPLSMYSIALAFTVWDHNISYYYVSPLCGAIPAAIFTAGLLQPHRTFMHAILEHPIPVFCGRICYGLYIWHYPIFALLREHGAPYIVIFLVGWPIAFALAIASYYLIERHFMKARPV